MVDIIQPLDFLGRMGGMANMPNLIGNADAVTQQREREAATIDALQARAMAEQAQAQAAQQEQIDAQRFQNDLATFGDGSPKSIVMMMQRNPKYAKLLSDAHALEKADIQEADTLFLNSIYARAANGDFAGAAAQARRRLEAEKAAGNDTTDEQAMVDQLESGDPVLQQRAMRVIGGDLAGRVGLEKFAAVYGGVTTADGNIVNRATGDVTYQGKPTARTPIKMDGGTDAFGNKLPDYLVDPETYQRIEVGGGVSASGGGNFERAHQFVASVEGGYAARDGKSGAPVNYGVNQAANPDVDVKSLTPDTAKQILYDRYWVPSGAAAIADPALATVVYDTAVNMGPGMAKAMLKASGGDVEKFLDAREKRYRAIGGPSLPAWLDRNEQLRAMVSGGSGAAPAGRERTQKELAFRYGAPPAGQILTQDGRRIRDPLSEKGSGKTLPTPALDKLNLQAETTAQIADLIGGFQDGFSGPNIGNATGASNLAGRMGADGFAAQADWWQRMGQFDNVVRNELFGASLTAGEQAAWKATTVTPTMAPARVRANLAKRRAILDRALARKIKTYGAAGYNIEDVGAELIAPTAINFADLP